MTVGPGGSAGTVTTSCGFIVLPVESVISRFFTTRAEVKTEVVPEVNRTLHFCLFRVLRSKR